MIRLIQPALIAIILAVTFPTIALADSLVCQYYINGEYKTLIYTEVNDPKPNEIETVYSHGKVLFGNYSSIQLNSEDCIFIKDKIDKEQIALDHFLRQLFPDRLGLGGYYNYDNDRERLGGYPGHDLE